MILSKKEWSVLGLFTATLPLFIIAFIVQNNYEFMGYVVVTLALFGLLLYSHKYVQYPLYVLWCLLVWAILHMLGGVEFAPGEVIYTFVICPIISEPYSILKYDQVVHAYGFFVATLVMFSVLHRYLVVRFSWTAVGIVLAMAGLGLGALNEIIEFGMTITMPRTNVGGYENTALDLVFNLVGAIAAALFLRWKELKGVKLINKD
ncbi:hypothetical protein A3C87_02050 [Candidatus Kaiserbacteria bacterium RIFCSPHIGHO2_02_FULL_49_34]|uniref:DUF2238 domain-containing protein n=1 Tax=Candidatus Kaiserbacteria bacterium RIFCSPHIGHO2_02_FULL_49_34 TaxID=1798491 RepID=A0A1F6DIA4_9BACT|nr:MAG: hypothetical protein A3C87_02050 [Candidatus Kaiserbacteria bacterium RIFCSPHIGHO2_02_FULL_49_34]